jgi:hypothetical protein
LILLDVVDFKVASLVTFGFYMALLADSLMSLCTPDEEMQEDDSSDVVEESCLQRKELDDNHLWFPEYHREIYQYLREAEV